MKTKKINIKELEQVDNDINDEVVSDKCVCPKCGYEFEK